MTLLSLTTFETVSQEVITRLAGGVMTLGKKLIIALIIWFIGKKLVKYAEKLATIAFEKGKLEPSVSKFLASLIRVLCYAVLVITIVSVLGIQTTSLITLIGSAGVTVGLALQGSLSNFAGGVLILVFKPFRVGDYIVACGQEGTVQAIEIIYTRIATIDNKIITIPNGTLANSNIVNVGCEPFRMVDINVGISYGADIKKAKAVLENVIAKNRLVLQDKAVTVFVNSLDQSAVTIQTRCWCKTGDYWTVRWGLLESYKEALDENGIVIPFNQLDVHIKKEEA
jgi:small conductance mechanosensitive channel